MKKRILIDASTVPSQTDGLSQYIINLLKYLPEESFNDFEFSVLINDEVKRKELSDVLQCRNYHIINEKIAPIGPKRDWNMFWFLSKNRKKFDLIHITSNNYPFSLKNGICTIHDITFKKYFDNPRFTFNLATTYMDWVIRNCLRNARKIIAVSNSTKKELCKWYHLNEKQADKITVIHEGWEHLEKGHENFDCAEEIVVTGNYLFYVGSFRKHKNIATLLLAFQRAIKDLPPHIKLVITGNNKHMHQRDRELCAEINKSGERVFLTGFLSDACVEQYARKADAFIVPSLSEGFGLPIIEALYYKRPVLCSNTTSLPEVAGEAALYFNPHDPEDIAKTIIKFYSNPFLADQLVTAGNLQLKKFSWIATARETVEVYRTCLNK